MKKLIKGLFAILFAFLLFGCDAPDHAGANNKETNNSVVIETSRKIVYTVDYSIEGNSLVIMLKAGYIWGSDNNGESVEIPLYALSEPDYDDRKLNRQLYEVVYKNGVYYHIRVERGFLPREYLEDIYKEMTVIES